MIYPFVIEDASKVRKALIEKKIYVAQYWPDVLNIAPKNSPSYFFSENIIALPVDQRQSANEMQTIVDTIKNLWK